MKVKDLLHLDPETEITLWYWSGTGSRFFVANPTITSMENKHSGHFDIIVNLSPAYDITKIINKMDGIKEEYDY